MKVYSLLTVVSVLCPLLLGCDVSPRRGEIGDPVALVRRLIDKNGLGDLPPAERVPLPRGRDWDHLTLSYFPGGVAVDWAKSTKATYWLLFRSDGEFMADVLQYRALPLTGEGAHDLVTAEYGSAGVHLVLRSLDEDHRDAVKLASMVKYAYAASMFPSPWDADGDGVLELVCCLQAGALEQTVTSETRLVSADPAQPVLVVWSLRNVVPRIVLALGDCCEFEGLNWMSSNLYVQSRKVEWDAAAGRFRVPELEGVQVLLNRSLGQNSRETDLAPKQPAR